MMIVTIEKKSKYDGDMEKELNGFKFALKAKGIKNSREILNKVLIDNGMVVCTDGSRLHLFLTHIDIESGLYEVISNKANQIILGKTDFEDNQFPAYEKVIPVPRWQSRISCNGQDWPLFTEIYKNFTHDCVSFQTDFIHDAYMGNSEISLYKDMERNWSPLVMYDNDRRAAIVMPVKAN